MDRARIDTRAFDPKIESRWHLDAFIEDRQARDGVGGRRGRTVVLTRRSRHGLCSPASSRWHEPELWQEPKELAWVCQ